ncbi:hypothetical protein TNIN_488351 [Trichonephila inaurata madagascariensis]|uniref:Uncharacterized protein n=1 Tax=Trichonephila inaurata madagascariensis TaxID=2747483 RepID=A0A8X7C089_9ARAC|nr:hypothetical protein TNIN_488351 [Trichonephila inaurata madagascariensis]
MGLGTRLVKRSTWGKPNHQFFLRPEREKHSTPSSKRNDDSVATYNLKYFPRSILPCQKKTSEKLRLKSRDPATNHKQRMLPVIRSVILP